MNTTIYSEITEEMLRQTLIGSLLEIHGNDKNIGEIIDAAKKINTLDLTNSVKKLNRIIKKYGLVNDIYQELDKPDNRTIIEILEDENYDHSVFETLGLCFSGHTIFHSQVMIEKTWDLLRKKLEN